jgi:hypothetical protein
MSGQPDDSRDGGEEARLAQQLRAALAARDRAMGPPPLELAPRAARPSIPFPVWVAGAAAAAAVVAFVLWTTRYPGTRFPGGASTLSAETVAELSSPDYWRVPSDRLLALAPPPVTAQELPEIPSFRVSLEESVL